MLLNVLNRDPMVEGPGGTASPESMKGDSSRSLQHLRNKFEMLPCCGICKWYTCGPFGCKQRCIFGAGYTWYMARSATMGHREEAPNLGILIVLVPRLSWSVFDHFMITVAPCVLNNTSPLVRCLVGSKEAVE